MARKARGKKKRNKPAKQARASWVLGLLLLVGGIVLGFGLGLGVSRVAPPLRPPSAELGIADEQAAESAASAPVITEPAPPAHEPAPAEEAPHQSAESWPESIVSESIVSGPIVSGPIARPTEPSAPATDAAAPEPEPGPEAGGTDLAFLTPGTKDPQWLANAVSVPAANGRPMIAIVIDDVGAAPHLAEAAVRLPSPVTIAVMTYAQDAAGLARRARKHGHEILVHVPMQPLNASLDPGPNVLAVGLPRDEIERRLAWDLDRFPGYVGFNNHMGSRFTQDEAGMRVVLEAAKARGLIFLDSKTIGASVGDRLAKEMGVVHVARDVFLDDEISQTAVARQLAATEAIARRQGYAVAIGHPHPSTMAALKAWISMAKARGFHLVPLSAIVKKLNGLAG